MKNKFIAMTISMVLTLTMMMPAMGASGDNWEDDNAPWNVGITNSKLLGDYQIGTSKEFEIGYYPSDNVGLKAVRHMEITGDSEVSNFQYYENNQWNDIADFTSEITFTSTVYQKVRVTFNEAGIYTIKFWASTVSGDQSVVAKRVISVSDEGIALYQEPETTEPPTSEPETSTSEPVTDEPETPTSEPVTDEPETPTSEPVTDEPETPTSEPVTDEPETPTLEPVTDEPETPTSQPVTDETAAPTTEHGTTVSPTASKITKPGVTSVKKATKKKKAKKAKISLKKVKNASGYQIQVSTSAKFAKKATITKATKKTSYTIKSLKPGKKYYVRARAYVKKGKSKIYSKWCKKKRIKFIK